MSQKLKLRQDIVGQRQYVMTLDHITATAGTARWRRGRTDDGRVRAGSPLQTGGANRLTVSYTVTGVVRTIDSGTALQWALLQGLSAQVTEFHGDNREGAQAVHLRRVQCGQPELRGAVPVPASGGPARRRCRPSPTPAARGRWSRSTSGPRLGRCRRPNEQSRSSGFLAKPLPLGIVPSSRCWAGWVCSPCTARARRDAAAQPGGAGSCRWERAAEFRVVGDVRPRRDRNPRRRQVDQRGRQQLLDLAVHPDHRAGE